LWRGLDYHEVVSLALEELKRAASAI
jgi:hypothetical protein